MISASVFSISLGVTIALVGYYFERRGNKRNESKVKEYMQRVHYPQMGRNLTKYTQPIKFRDLTLAITTHDDKGKQMDIGQASEASKILLRELSYYSNEETISILNNYRGTRYPKPY